LTQTLLRRGGLELLFHCWVYYRGAILVAQASIMKNVKHVLCSVLSSCFWLSALPTPARADQAKLPTISPSFLADLRSGEVNRVSSALAAGANPNARDTNGNTPLMWSAIYGDVGCLKLLVEAGAEVDATNALGATALMRSAFDYEKVRPAGGTRRRRQPQVGAWQLGLDIGSAPGRFTSRSGIPVRSRRQRPCDQLPGARPR
jgi:hypothetical protein